MPLNRAEALEVIMATCPHCKSGLEPTKNRQNEWTHTQVGQKVSITLCLASHFRNSHFMTEIENG
jgi:hypothetical protein